MTRYLVTGAAGNLARLLVDRLLKDGKEVTGTDLSPPVIPGVRFEQSDITDSEGLEKLVADVRPECILHMASLLTLSSETDPATAWRINATASVDLMRIASKHNVDCFFFPSTVATYAGQLPDPLPEDHPQWPVTIYGVSKVSVERMGAYLWQTASLNFRAVRLPVVVSPYAPPGAVSAYPSHAFLAARRGEPFIYPAPSDLRVSTIYVLDVIEGILKLVGGDESRLSRRVYNLHSFSPSTQDFADAVTRRVDGFQYRFAPSENVISMLGTIPSVLTDTSARRDWDWNPRFDLDGCANDLAQFENL